MEPKFEIKAKEIPTEDLGRFLVEYFHLKAESAKNFVNAARAGKAALQHEPYKSLAVAKDPATLHLTTENLEFSMIEDQPDLWIVRGTFFREIPPIHHNPESPSEGVPSW